MNRESIPFLDTCLNDLLYEEHLFLLNPPWNNNIPHQFMWPIQHKVGHEVEMNIIQCFYFKGFRHFTVNCPRKFCNCYKKDEHVIEECLTWHPKKKETTYTTSIDSSSFGSFVTQTALTQVHAPTPIFAQSITLDMIQQMIMSVFSTLRLSCKPFSTSSPWYFDYVAFHHMTNTVDSLINVRKYSRNLKIQTIDGNQFAIIATGDVSSSITMSSYPLV